MGVLQRFERRLEGLVGNAFARLFKGQVEPVEVAKALQREAEEKRAIVGAGRVLVPNRYEVDLGPTDYDRLAPWEAQLTGTLAEMVQEHVDDEGWSTFGDIEVRLARAEDLPTGVFRINSGVDPDADPRQRPVYHGDEPSGAYQNPDQYLGQLGQQIGHQDPPGQYNGQQYGGPSSGQQPAAPMSPAGPLGAGMPGMPAGAPPLGGPPPLGPLSGSQEAARYGEYGDRYEEREQPGYQSGGYPAQSRHWLRVDGTDRQIALEIGNNVVGRGQDADLRLADTGVSRKHIEIRFDGQSATLYDLGSTNGTIVNGHRVQHWQLADGDVIRIGHSVLVYRQGNA